jgi:hypothetical protein
VSLKVFAVLLPLKLSLLATRIESLILELIFSCFSLVFSSRLYDRNNFDLIQSHLPDLETSNPILISNSNSTSISISICISILITISTSTSIP